MATLGTVHFGYDVLSYGDARLRTLLIPGTNPVCRFSFYNPTAPLLIAVARDYNREVERLRPADSGCHNPRHIDNDKNKPWSNHGSGTAVDLNWKSHPLGAVGTHNAAQVAAIRRILKRYTMDGVQLIRWGGDYPDRKDEMHFEINVRESVALTGVRWLQAGGVTMPLIDDRDFHTLIYRVKALLDNAEAFTVPAHGPSPARPETNKLAKALSGVATVAALAPKLEAILAAAQDDGNATVVLDPDSIAALSELRAAVAALTDTVEQGDAVAGIGEDGTAAVPAQR